jgi:hypothetical protein
MFVSAIKKENWMDKCSKLQPSGNPGNNVINIRIKNTLLFKCSFLPSQLYLPSTSYLLNVAEMIQFM